MVPENVLDVLAEIRETAEANMLDQEKVISIADVMDEGAADWLRSNPLLYIEALNQMGARVNGGHEE